MEIYGIEMEGLIIMRYGYAKETQYLGLRLRKRLSAIGAEYRSVGETWLFRGPNRVQV